MPRPTMDIMVNSMISDGKAIQASTNLCPMMSNLPPKYPEGTPIIAATTILTVVPAKADDHRDAGSVDKAAEDISSQLVRTQQVLR